ncbi:MAG: T9SS type A sorting domain-containing protein [Bacteroidota bacterium]|nr:T9SS type A sorting domain-containing protein [Bacteroidota bacterium]
MLKKIILILLICYYSSYSQNVIRFSKQYDFFDTNGSTSSYLSVNAFTVNNDYLLCGVVNTPSINQGLGIVRVDSVGTIKYQKQFNSPNNLRFTNGTANQAYIKLKNNNVLFTGQYVLGLDYFSACMARVNHTTGDTVWTKMYKQPGDTTYLLCSTELQDSSILSLGFRYYLIGTTLFSKPFMMNVDKNGTYKWHKWINTSWSNNNTLFLYQKIIKITDNDFIVLGMKQTAVFNGFVMRIDTNAVKQYEVNTPVLSSNTYFNDFIELQDGSYLACGNLYTASGKTKKLVYNFNGTTGAKIKHKLYNVEANSNGLVTLIQKPNGIILLGGGTGANIPVNSVNITGDILWINSNLDSLKSIYFNTPNAADQVSPNQIILTPDGGFASNISSYTFGSGLQQKFWLVKADSNGCYTSTCAAVGLNEFASTSSATIKIFPNPADDVLNVELLNLASTGSATEIQIINTLGQVVHQSTIKTVTLSGVEGQQSTIDIKDLPEGVYQLKISEGKKQRVLKFIKN